MTGRTQGLIVAAGGSALYVVIFAAIMVLLRDPTATAALNRVRKRKQ
ncbi:hypothetical protein [Microbacterium sp. NPDC064584]